MGVARLDNFVRKSCAPVCIFFYGVFKNFLLYFMLLHFDAEQLPSYVFFFFFYLYIYIYKYTGWPRKNGTVNTVDFSGLCSEQLLFFHLAG